MAADVRPKAPTVVEGSMDWMILEAAKRAKAAPTMASEADPEPAAEPLADLESASPESELAPEPLAELESADPAPLQSASPEQPEVAPEPLAELESADLALAPEPVPVAKLGPPAAGDGEDSDEETF